MWQIVWCAHTMYINFEWRFLQYLYLWCMQRQCHKIQNSWFVWWRTKILHARPSWFVFHDGGMVFIMVFVVKEEVDQWSFYCKNKKTTLVLFLQLQTKGKLIVEPDWLIAGKIEAVYLWFKWWFWCNYGNKMLILGSQASDDILFQLKKLINVLTLLDFRHLIVDKGEMTVVTFWRLSRIPMWSNARYDLCMFDFNSPWKQDKVDQFIDHFCFGSNAKSPYNWL